MKNKKGFTLIELLAVIVILSLLVGVGIISVTRYLGTSRKGVMVTSFSNAYDAVKEDVLEKGLTSAKTYTLSNINDLLERKLTKSPYNNDYSNDSYISVVFKDGKASYNVCLTDGSQGIKSKDTNGTDFKVTDVKSCVLTQEELKESLVAQYGSYQATAQNDSCFTYGMDTDYNGVRINNYDYETCGLDVVIPAYVQINKGTYEFHVDVCKTVIMQESGSTEEEALEECNEYKKMNDNGTLVNEMDQSDIDTFIELGLFTLKESKIYTYPVVSIGMLAISPHDENYNNLTTKIKSVILPPTLKSIGNAAFHYQELKSITFPEALEKIGMSSFRLNNFTTIKIPKNVTVIGNSSFESNFLTKVEFETGSKLTSIDEQAFRDNYITSFDFSKLTELTTIKKKAFYNSGTLNHIVSIDLSKTKVKSIGEQAFASNYSTYIKLPTTVETMGKNAFWVPYSTTATVINPTGKAFDWNQIFSYQSGESMVTGTIQIDGTTITIKDKE